MQSSTPWSGQRILIVDDSEKIRKELKRQFEALGLRVVGEAGNGVEALEVCSAVAPDLISLDIIMPEMNGIDCYRQLRKSGFSGGIMVISCLAAEPSVVDGFGAEIPSYLFVPKPVTPSALEHRLSKIFNPPALEAATSSAA